MKKRKEISSSSSSSAVSEPIKKTARPDKPEQKLKSPTPLPQPLEKKSFIMPGAGRWDILPTVLWVMAIKFLTKEELVEIPLVSKMFMNLFVERTIKLHKKEFPEINAFYPDKYTDLSVSTQLCLFNDFKEKYDSYLTLIDRSYIPLFSCINKYDVESAIAFIHSKVQSTSTKDSKENVTDMVFFQKNSQGHTAINLAQQLGLQDFLDYCFQQLILNGAELNKDKYSLIKIGHYPEILHQLDTIGMSPEALWMYGCAYVCDQKKICREISEKRLWRKTWMDDRLNISLALVSAFLSSINLAKHVLDDVDASQRNYLLYTEPLYESREIYYNKASINCIPMDVAACSKNKAVIDYFMSFSHQISYTRINSLELVAFYIYSKDISGIRRIRSVLAGEDPVISFNQKIYIDPKYLGIDYEVHQQLSLLGVAIAKDWLPGVEEFISYGISLDGNIDTNGEFSVNSLGLAIDFGHIEIAKYLLSRGANANGSDIPDYPESSPIFNAIENGNLDCVKLLVEHKASLTIKNRTHGEDEYPLISAILEDEKEIIQYIIGILGRTQALHQLSEELLLRAGPNLTQERPMIGNVYDNLLKPAKPGQGVTFFNPSTDSSLQSTSSQGNGCGINLTS